MVHPVPLILNYDEASVKPPRRKAIELPAFVEDRIFDLDSGRQVRELLQDGQRLALAWGVVELRVRGRLLARCTSPDGVEAFVVIDHGIRDDIQHCLPWKR